METQEMITSKFEESYYSTLLIDEERIDVVSGEI